MAPPASHGGRRDVDDHFTFHWCVVEDIHPHDGVTPDKAGVAVVTDNSVAVLGGMDAPQRMFDCVNPAACPLHGPHARIGCMAGAAAARGAGAALSGIPRRALCRE